MRFTETSLPGVVIIDVDVHADDRGEFFRTLCAREFEARALVSAFWVADAGRGVRWDDQACGIEWPEVAVRHLSERDRTYPDFVG